MINTKCSECEKEFAWDVIDEDSDLVESKTCKGNAYWKLSAHFINKHPEKLMRCGRRSENWISANESGKLDFWRGGGYGCSYCGSISPNELFAAIENGSEITPTDKSYKIYVDSNRKFYFQHLSLEEQDCFIKLCNENKIKFAYPGHFYVRPFFCAPVESN